MGVCSVQSFLAFIPFILATMSELLISSPLDVLRRPRDLGIQALVLRSNLKGGVRFSAAGEGARRGFPAQGV